MIFNCTVMVHLLIIAPQCDNYVAYLAQFLSKSQFLISNDWNKIALNQFALLGKVGIKRKFRRKARE
ncbi:hypothetical protein DA096_14815 [Vibrio rotiferianus]|uniref:Uncharacterized protein n=1 Tax=Vibrio rotiferianus TaxID=190895 RepID=A0A2K7SQG7_9VIBR|nr:hypothetical protein BSZ04_22740 [Vibrio rotiferianus]NOH46728.1 hypothetical protein [Vibrio rotiferianus]NOH65104.1 hypothetical protein [Vibrio rotiferianus]OHY89924.1 hypothetical protein BI375_06655 [Vibrio rotiferianus]TMX44267.1 hypothetical protein DA095_00265 [Vibrio rotiferianus]